MSDENEYLGQGFVESWQEYPEQTALVVGENEFTYAELGTRALSIKKTLTQDGISETNNVGLLTGKCPDAYAGILGTLLAGKSYVPMKPDHPTERNQQILEDCSIDLILADSDGVENLPDILQKLSTPISVILLTDEGKAENNEIVHIQEADQILNIDSQREIIKTPDSNIFPNISSDATAYVLFTSGSTGRPKGVPITHRNVRSYLRYVSNCYEFKKSDKFSQFFDLTFDLSVHDMFITWSSGGSLYVVPENKQMAPGNFIRKRRLTVWFTVPSTVMFMSRFNQLQPNSYPDLRYSLFCGEALSGRLAEKWQAAAPNSAVENLYGPTESTIATARYRWQPDKSLEQCENGITPIGEIFSTQDYQIIDQDNVAINQGEEGELCVSGPQVFDSYLNRPTESKKSFIQSDGKKWYLTGDLVREDEDGVLHFISRIDNQIQIRGHRVELLEIEAILREVTGIEMVAAVGWPIEDSIAQSIHAFIAADPERVDRSQVIAECGSELPDYMVPKKIHVIDDMPLNVNGKIDRDQLVERLSQEHTST